MVMLRAAPPESFSPVRFSLAAPCNYRPADKMDSGHGLVFVAAALVAQALSVSTSPKTPLGLHHPATASRWYRLASRLEPASLRRFDREGLN